MAAAGWMAILLTALTFFAILFLYFHLVDPAISDLLKTEGATGK